jgi:hypothetical protein
LAEITILLLCCGCGRGNELRVDPTEVKKNEPLAKAIIRLRVKLAETWEEAFEASLKNPFASLLYRPKTQKLDAAIKAKSDEFEKLPREVQMALNILFRPEMEATEKRLQKVLADYQAWNAENSVRLKAMQEPK